MRAEVGTRFPFIYMNFRSWKRRAVVRLRRNPRKSRSSRRQKVSRAAAGAGMSRQVPVLKCRSPSPAAVDVTAIY